jgi:quinol-cytochrome oxidoreductase complex cytochrome b subunit
VNEVAEDVKKEDAVESSRPFLPNHVLDEIGVVFLVIGIAIIFASLFRPEELSLPKIFFAGAIEMTEMFFPLFATLVILALIAFLIALPFLDKSEERHPKKRIVWVLIVLGFIGLWLAFTIMGF